MADIRKLTPFILKWEGGFVNDPADLGGATNKGVTFKTFKDYCKKKGRPEPTIDDLKGISDEDWTDIIKGLYWDKWKADQIRNQSIANILVDWVWMSGAHGIKRPQAVLGVDVDGKVGPKTINAINEYPSQEELFYKIKEERKKFINEICASRPANEKFRKGWTNRLKELDFSEK